MALSAGRVRDGFLVSGSFSSAVNRNLQFNCGVQNLRETGNVCAHCLPCPTAREKAAAYDFRMTPRLLSRQAPALVSRQQLVQVRARRADREVVAAEADYERLRQVCLDLSKGEGNEVALAMVGADMERANRSLQSLISARKPPTAHGRRDASEREARHLAEEGA